MQDDNIFSVHEAAESPGQTESFLAGRIANYLNNDMT